MAESSVPGAVGERPDPNYRLRDALSAFVEWADQGGTLMPPEAVEAARAALAGGAVGEREEPDYDGEGLSQRYNLHGPVGEREEPLEQARDALLSVLTVCGLEGQDPSNTALAFQMIRDFARPAYDALVEAEKADD